MHTLNADINCFTGPFRHMQGGNGARVLRSSSYALRTRLTMSTIAKAAITLVFDSNERK